jgi:hypothetical protein
LLNGGTNDELDAWAVRMISLPGEQVYASTPDGEPSIMGGIIPHGHIGVTWLAGTDRVNEVAVNFMRQFLRAHRKLSSVGVRRFQGYCLDGPDELFTWLAKLGYKREGKHPGMGLHGETYVSFGKCD